MSDIGLGPPVTEKRPIGLRQRLLRLAASPGFQKWAAAFPLTRRTTRREGEAMFDLVSGFVQTQCLAALVEFGTLDVLVDRPQSLARLASLARVPAPRMAVLLDAGIALGLLAREGDAFQITVRGAALTAVPGLKDMIAHHAVLYRDLSDPARFFRGETETELARFWPYVFGEGADQDPETAHRYSRLMAESQALVASETLATVNLTRHSVLLDVGGGTGAFLDAALRVTPGLKGILFDLPQVSAAASERFAGSPLANRVEIRSGSFRDDSLPLGADAISLVRVLYDHADDTVSRLLNKVHSALQPGGMLLVSEPMKGQPAPSRAGDVYFPVYTLAMETGRTRRPAEIAEMVRSAGFAEVSHRKTRRPFITSVITARRL